MTKRLVISDVHSSIRQALHMIKHCKSKCNMIDYNHTESVMILHITEETYSGR